MLPKDVLSHFNTAFAYAKQGRETRVRLGKSLPKIPFTLLHAIPLVCITNNFSQLSSGFHLNWPIKMQQLWVVELKSSDNIVNPTPHNNLYFDWPVAKEAKKM